MSVSASHQILVSLDAGLAPERTRHSILRLAPACDVSLQAHVTLYVLYYVILSLCTQNLCQRLLDFFF